MNKFTSAAEIHFITFERFLDEVSTLVVEHDQDYMVTYTEQVNSSGIFGGSAMAGYEIDNNITIFQDRRIELDRFINIEARKHQLKLQLPYELVLYPDHLMFVVEDLAVLSVVHYGAPTLAVNISPRQWMVCDPNDFVILKEPNGIRSTLVCKHRYRNKIVRIGRK